MVDSRHRHRPELQGVEHQPAQRHVALPDDGQHARHAVQQYSRVQYSNVQYSTVQYLVSMCEMILVPVTLFCISSITDRPREVGLFHFGCI